MIENTPNLEVQAHEVVVAKVDEQVVVVIDGRVTVHTQDFSAEHLERILEALGMDFAEELVNGDEVPPAEVSKIIAAGDGDAVGS